MQFNLIFLRNKAVTGAVQFVAWPSLIVGGEDTARRAPPHVVSSRTGDIYIYTTWKLFIFNTYVYTAFVAPKSREF